MKVIANDPTDDVSHCEEMSVVRITTTYMEILPGNWTVVGETMELLYTIGCPPIGGGGGMTEDRRKAYEQRNDSFTNCMKCLLQDPISWSNSSSDEIVQQIQDQLLLLHFRNRCLDDLPYQPFRLRSHFSDFDDSWVFGDDIDGDLCGSTFNAHVSMSVPLGGNCSSCMEPSPSIDQMPDGRMRLNYYSCNSNGSTSVPCLSIYVDESDWESYEDRFINYDCP